MYEFLNVVDFASTYNTLAAFGVIMLTPVFAWLAVIALGAVDRLFIDKKHDVLVWTVQEEEIWKEEEVELCLARCASEFDALTTTHSYPLDLLEEYFFGHTMEELEEALSCLPGQSVVWDEWDRANDTDELDELWDRIDRQDQLTFGQWIKPCPA